MFSLFNKAKQIVDKYINDYNINKNNIYFLRHKLSFQDNPKEYLNDFFKDIKQDSIVVITETIVYDEDAYINAAAAQIYDNHRRFYTVNEILDFIKDDARLSCFLNFKETVYIDNIIQQAKDDTVKYEIVKLLNDFPDSVKNLLSFKEENGRLVSFEANAAVFILIKK